MRPVIVLALIAGGTGGIAAPPVGGVGPPIGKLPAPTLLKSYTVQLYDAGVYGMRVPQFDPAKGQLRGVKAKLSGTAAYKVTLNAAPAGAQPYALTAYAPAYFEGNAWVDLKAAKAGSFAGDAVQAVYAPAAPADDGTVHGPSVLKMFVGKSTLGIALTPDLPLFTEGKALVKTVEKGQSSLGGSITYTYLPAIPPIIYKPK